jgi:hypothetical protein
MTIILHTGAAVHELHLSPQRNLAAVRSAVSSVRWLTRVSRRVLE